MQISRLLVWMKDDEMVATEDYLAGLRDDFHLAKFLGWASP